MILIDTETLIKVLEGDKEVAHVIESLPSSPSIISLSKTEIALEVCSTDRSLYEELEEFFSLFINIYPCKKSCELSFELSKRYCIHELIIPRESIFLTAATAITNNLSLYTVFPESYKDISGLRIFSSQFSLKSDYIL